MSQTRTVAYNSLIQLVGRIVGVLLGLFTLRLVTPALLPDAFAEYKVVLTYLSLFVVCADGGLTTICVREMARDERHSERILGNALALRIAMGLALVPVAIGIAFLLYGTPKHADVRTGVIAAACVVPMQLVNMSLIAVFQVRQRMVYAVAGEVLGRLAQFAAVYLLVKSLRLGLYSALIAVWLGMAVNLLASVVAAGRLMRVRLYFELPVWRSFVFAAVPLGLAVILSSVYFRIDTLLLYQMIPEKLVGLYTTAASVYEYSLNLSSVFITAAFPILVGHAALGLARVRPGIQRSFDFLALMAAPVAVGTVVLAPQAIALVTRSTSAYAGAAAPLRVLITAAAFSYLTSLMAYLLVAIDRQRDTLVVNALILVSNIGLNLLLIPRLGIMGAAWATLATECLSLCCTSAFVRQRYHFYPSLKQIPRILLAAGLMGLALRWADRHGLPLPALFVIGVGVYTALVLALRVVDWTTVTEIFRFRRPLAIPVSASEALEEVGTRG
jgi:O-antigen/teichoic acid export membrane protein